MCAWASDSKHEWAARPPQTVSLRPYSPFVERLGHYQTATTGAVRPRLDAAPTATEKLHVYLHREPIRFVDVLAGCRCDVESRS
jgi:hypothetical protein